MSIRRKRSRKGLIRGTSNGRRNTWNQFIFSHANHHSGSEKWAATRRRIAFPGFGSKFRKNRQFASVVAAQRHAFPRAASRLNASTDVIRDELKRAKLCVMISHTAERAWAVLLGSVSASSDGRVHITLASVHRCRKHSSALCAGSSILFWLKQSRTSSVDGLM